MFRFAVLYSVVAFALSRPAYGFTPIIAAATIAPPDAATTDQAPASILEPKDVVTRVAVAGATGRTGRVVVEELLARGITNVVALTRDETYAGEVFPEPPENLQLLKCDLSNERQLKKGTHNKIVLQCLGCAGRKEVVGIYNCILLEPFLSHLFVLSYLQRILALEGVDAVIWCATGFSSNPKSNPLEKAKGFLDLALKRTIDVTALPKMAQQIKTHNEQQQMATKNNNQPPGGRLPKVVMLSSAGVTRTIWDERKKALMPGAADIPIVRLNPFGALDIKRESEEKLRETGTCSSAIIVAGIMKETS